MEERRPNLVSALNQMGDFYMELKWDFQSWGEHYFCLNLISLGEVILVGVNILCILATDYWFSDFITQQTLFL